MYRQDKRYCETDSEASDHLRQDHALTLMANPSRNHQSIQKPSRRTESPTKNYMVISNPSGFDCNGVARKEKDLPKHSETSSFTSLLNSVDTESVLKKCSTWLLGFLSSSQRILGFLLVIIFVIYYCPLITLSIVGCMLLILIGGHNEDNTRATSRTAKWTVTGFSQQIKGGFIASPPFLDKSGQWRMIIKQKRGMDGVQTGFGIMCTDMPANVESVTAKVSFSCANQYGQELSSGGMRNLQFQYEYQCPGDCGYSRPIRLQRCQLGAEDTITIHCTVEFQKKTITFFKTLVRNLREGEEGDDDINGRRKKGKNVVTERGTVFPGEIEFYDNITSDLPPVFRQMARFVHHPETRTYVWEIPEFATLLENSELWGIYSPQFFLNSNDACSVWRMKLLEVQGVFRLHVQLRGLPRSVKQVKLWYLLQLVDSCGDSMIPEHALYRVKYPDHMNLWDTTRHILYRRETILDRFVSSSGALTLRISLQMEPNELTLMGVDSDEWIACQLDSSMKIGDEGMIHEQQKQCLEN